MQTKFQIDDLVLIKKNDTEYHTTGDKTPVVYKVYQVLCTKDKPTEYVLDFINTDTNVKTKSFIEDKLDPVPADHPLFTIFGTRPVSAKNENGDT
jgi:hypothetical protein